MTERAKHLLATFHGLLRWLYFSYFDWHGRLSSHEEWADQKSETILRVLTELRFLEMSRLACVEGARVSMFRCQSTQSSNRGNLLPTFEEEHGSLFRLMH